MGDLEIVGYEWLQWGFTEFNGLFDDDKKEFWYKVKKYYDGDHFQKGEAWIGPIVEKNHKEYRSMLKTIEKGFISVNKIAEIVERKLSNLTNNVYSLEFFEGKNQNRYTKEIKTLTANWWDEKELDYHFKQAALDLILLGKLAVRTFIPYARLKNNKLVVSPDRIADSIFVEFLPPEDVTEYLDPITMVKIIVYRYEFAEKQRLEISWVNPENNMTHIRVYERGNDEPTEYIFDYNGLLPIIVLEDKPLITPQITQNQNALNVALTMIERNQELAGFLERYFLNAEEPESLEVGPSVSTYVMGKEVEDEYGKSTYLNPSLFFKEPVDNNKLELGIKVFKQNILDEARQLHALNADNVNMSEDSRRQAMADYISSLEQTGIILNRLGNWLIELFLAMLVYYGNGKYARVKNIGGSFALNITSGVTPLPLLTLALSYFEQDIISKKRLRVLFGVKDTEAEDSQVINEKIEELKRVAETLEKYDLHPLPEEETS